MTRPCSSTGNPPTVCSRRGAIGINCSNISKPVLSFTDLLNPEYHSTADLDNDVASNNAEPPALLISKAKLFGVLSELISI